MSESVEHGSVCPYLHRVNGDLLWVYPVAAFCHRPGGGIRVPASATLARLCTTPAHRRCLEASRIAGADRSA
jgi:hypothetical protein